jgi:hypothetical protein
MDVHIFLYNDGNFLDLPSDKRISILYNLSLACGCSLVGEKIKAASFLEQALAAAYCDYYELQEEK